MAEALIIVGILAMLALGTYISLRRARIKQVREMAEAFRTVQQAALDHVTEAGSPDHKSLQEHLQFPDAQFHMTLQRIGMAYVIVRDGGRHVHRLYAQAANPGISEKAMAHFSLLMMAEVIGQLEMLPEADRPKFEVSRPGLVTHCFCFTLTDEQQAKFAEVVAAHGSEAAPPRDLPEKLRAYLDA